MTLLTVYNSSSLTTYYGKLGSPRSTAYNKKFLICRILFLFCFSWYSQQVIAAKFNPKKGTAEQKFGNRWSTEYYNE